MNTRTEDYTLVLITSGRWPYLVAALHSLRTNLVELPRRVICVNSSDKEPPETVQRPLRKLGFTVDLVHLPGASLSEVLAFVWHDAKITGLVFHFEEDFVLLRRLKLSVISQSLKEDQIYQVLLQRQRWYRREFNFKNIEESIVSLHGSMHHRDGLLIPAFFSLNPSLYIAEKLFALHPDETFRFGPVPELELSQVLGERRGASLLWPMSILPTVLHVGVLSTERHRELQQFGVGRRSYLWVRAHSARSFHALRLAISERWNRRDRSSNGA